VLVASHHETDAAGTGCIGLGILRRTVFGPIQGLDVLFGTA
jgi:hypothetical protein